MREISSISNTESSPLQLGASSHNLTHDNTHQESMKMSNDQFLPIQFSLSVGAVDDPLELEADAVADKVMRMPETPFIQRCACEEEKINRKHISSTITPFIQTKSSGAGVASESVSAQINSSRGSGNGMDTGTRSFMENRFGADFGNVSIHSDQKSVQMNRELNAQAFTVGNDIYFNSGKYSPQSDSGKHLLAHELTHVVQQNSGNTHINRQFIQRTPAQAAANQICYSTSAPPPTPSAREPELHPTYDLWLESFTGMSTFRSMILLLVKQH
ncbi:MAG: DUF4157 domain-containing protein [Bacteroidetes bacterium]|nr:DUF4157 domain-containing protein [Bacteroidota bacterium]